MRLRVLMPAIVAAMAVPAVASADVFFKTPSGNIVCQASAGKLECAVLSQRAGSSLPVYYLRPRGTTQRHHVVGNPAVEVPILAYGKPKRLLGGAATCTSQMSGLPCRNRSGHGFFLSKQRQRTF